MMEQVRHCAVWPMENWLGSFLNQIQLWTTVRESYSRALEQLSLVKPGLRARQHAQESGVGVDERRADRREVVIPLIFDPDLPGERRAHLAAKCPRAERHVNTELHILTFLQYVLDNALR